MNTATLSIPALKAALFAVSTEETRYYLNGVLVEISTDSVTYVATDGHIMFAHCATVSEHNTLIGQWIIPSEVIKGIKAKSYKTIPFAWLTQTDNDGLALELIADKVTIGFRPIDGHFPDWRRVVPETPTGEVTQGLQFNPHLLARLWKAGEVLNCPQPTITYNGDGPALLTYDALGESFGVIMPMRSKTTNATTPAWGRVSHTHQARNAA